MSSALNDSKASSPLKLSNAPSCYRTISTDGDTVNFQANTPFETRLLADITKLQAEMKETRAEMKELQAKEAKLYEAQVIIKALQALDQRAFDLLPSEIREHLYERGIFTVGRVLQDSKLLKLPTATRAAQSLDRNNILELRAALFTEYESLAVKQYLFIHPPVSKQDFYDLIPRLESKISSPAFQLLKSLGQANIMDDSGDWVPAFI